MWMIPAGGALWRPPQQRDSQPEARSKPDRIDPSNLGADVPVLHRRHRKCEQRPTESE